MPTSIQYLGHAAVKITTPSHVILVDPFLSGQGRDVKADTEGATHILLTHGHGDHVGDTVAIAKEKGIPVIAIVELAAWLQSQGVPAVTMANLGGTVDLGRNHSVTLVPAWHTSASDDGRYLGVAAGLVIRTATQVIYHAGDTSIFGDMALIQEMYQPTVGIVPIGGTFTMDATAAAMACRKFFHFSDIIPVHYATFPMLAQTADEFIEKGQGLPIRPLHPGESLSLA